MSFNEIKNLCFFRFHLLLRQKIGLFALFSGMLIVLLSFTFASVSFVKADKIFWDFSLGGIFILLSLLSMFFGTQIFAEEKAKRSLHLVLSFGVKRRSWIMGNFFGIWFFLVLMSGLSFIFSEALSTLVWGYFSMELLFQSLVLMWVESGILIAFSLALSLWLRPLLSLCATLSFFLFSHSVSSLERILRDPQLKSHLSSGGYYWVKYFSLLLPPLEYFDLKNFVGYQGPLSWFYILELLILGGAWIFWWLSLASLSLERTDL